ncbi:MAG: hypothetical protein K2M45_01090 [Muribaculaceae bacterium]|nr:hypothetical protein [Muribaculaceae bacterium]
MMKKVLFSLVGVGMLFTSCMKDPVSVSTQPVHTYNYVTLLSEDGTPDMSGSPVISQGAYSISWDNMKNTATITAGSVSLGDNKNVGFQTVAIPFTSVIMSFNDVPCPILHGFEANAGRASNGLEVKDLRYEISTCVYTPPTDIEINPKSPFAETLKFNSRGTAASKIRYMLGDKYQVYTFWPDLVYHGATTTEVTGMRPKADEGEDPGMGDIQTSYFDSEIEYRVKFDLEKKKVDLIIYNAKFNKDMPALKCLILPGLDVNLTNNGFVIEAENVIPQSIEGGEAVPYPKFPFTHLHFAAEGNMVEATFNFTVAGVFQGLFTGKYMEFVVR